jgi:glycosyltransferase involved in cell wall biosynthesis
LQILLVSPRYFPYIGGVEAHVKEISERLVTKGYAVEVLSCDPSLGLPEHAVINGVHVRRFKAWAPHEAYYFSRSLAKYLKKVSSPDIIHAHSYQAFPAYYASQTNSKAKLVFTPHYVGGGGTYFRNLLYTPYRYFGQRIFNKSTKIVCVAKYELNTLKEKFNLDNEKLVLIPNGVSLSEFEQLKKPIKKSQTILCVSRLEKYKGVQNAVQALTKMGDEVQLEIVGTGPYKPDLTNLVHNLGLDSRVTFYENLSRNELLERYASAGEFCLLSERECYGITIAEALCAGTPCIVAKTTALTEWVDNTNCLGVDYPININELVGTLKKALQIQVENVQVPDWNEIVSQLDVLYQSIL